ncbi:TonB-dependent receptor [Granulicella arctica]|uniref:TonB-dependent receptor n=1 Tax=Granulicella arctica TaxID=940613 RepID=UPI0021DFA3D0|nr:carboxypeptidase regulatory-like domain-containing protein [Granulicella arctica]
MHAPSRNTPSHFRSPFRPLRAALSLVVLACLAVPAAMAQFRASIQGTVTDPQGEVVPGAIVTLTDTATNKVLTSTSNESGVYNFNALPDSTFTMAAERPGFKKKVLSGIHITPEQSNAVNLQLDLGGATETINVNADTTPQLETANAAISGVVNDNQIQHLPSSGRDVFQLVQLAPGVFGDGSRATGGNSSSLPGTSGPGGSGSGIFQTENGPQANANGGQTNSNGIQIDGISTVSAVWGGTSVITPTEDSVGSVKVLSNGYDAENGRFSGANVQITSKTGSNQYHGSLFFRASRPGLNAYQRYNGAGTFNSGTPSDRGLLRDTTFANQYGGSVGGPILHDKLFAFFAYETQRGNTVATATGWYETAAFRGLAPAGSIASTYLNFPGGAVSASSLVNQTCSQAGFTEGQNCRTIAGQGLNLGSPINGGLGQQDLTWQSTTNPGIGGGLTNTPDIALYSTLNPTNQTAAQYNGRMDGDVTKRDHIAFAIYWVPLSKVNYNGTARAYNLFNHSQINDAYSVIYNHVFSPTFLNEARANDAGYRWNEVATNPQAPFGLPQSQVDGLANISGSNQLSFFGAGGPSNLNQHTFTYKDVATKILSNHTVKFGGDVTRLYYLNNPTYAARPSYNFYNIWDFLNDAPHSESGSFDSATGTPTTNRQDTREDLYGFFIQDDWKVRQNLTINAGIRYSYFGPFSSKQNNLGVVQLGSGATTYTGLSIRRGGNLTNAQKGNFGPQIGFAYSPDMFHGKAVVRGGFGLNYNQSEIAISGNSGNNPPYIFNANFNSSSINNGVATIDPRIRYGIGSSPTSLYGYASNPNAVTAFNAANLPLSGGVAVTAFQANQPTIYTEHFSLDTQFDLGHQMVATVGYQGSLGHHQIVQSQLYVNAFAAGQAQNPLVQNVDYYANTGASNNNSLLLGLKHNMAHHFMFDAEFAYAKTMDTGSFPYYEDPYPYRPDLAYGRSDFNYGKALKIYGLWQPVFFHGNSLLSKLADGFSFSGIYNIHTGFPFTPTYNVSGGNLYYGSSGYSSLRPTYIGSKNLDSSNNAFEIKGTNTNYPGNANVTTTSPYFINPTAPVAPGGGFATGLPSLPGMARNSFNGPGYQDVDATVTKSFGLPNGRVIGEHAAIEIRADAFNLFNQTNLNNSSIVTNILTPTFGQAQSGLAGRNVNLQARFSF